MLNTALYRDDALEIGPSRGRGPSTGDDACSLCGADDTVYPFISHGTPVRRCTACDLMTLLPRAAHRQRARYRDQHGHDPAVQYAPPADGDRTEREASDVYSELLAAEARPGASVLLVSLDGHPIRAALEARGFDVTSQYNVAEVEAATLPSEAFDCAVVVFQLEKTDEPIAVLEKIRAALRPGGQLLIVTPSLDSWPARALQERWTEWRPENLTYFRNETLQKALLRAGFDEVRIRQDRRRYSLEHVHERAATFPHTALTALIRMSIPRLPSVVRSFVRVGVPTSGIVAVARRAERRPRPTLSIVMPVFNEKASFERTVEQVLAKQVPGVEKELIIVESNSTDGTREVVERYRDRPGVVTIFQDRPRGKGNAVRQALARASGDIILVQDADDEYDVEDYDVLIEPLLRHQRAFVLGSRHSGDWRIRKFSDDSRSAGVLNIGHMVFQFLLNALYFQRLNDPFTMYKVFRRDCIFDVAFECDRFDFDFELVIKLLRKGYRPLEIPVTYRARSFSEGKKVSMFRDPITWIRALVRYRLGSIYVDGRR
jgi:SAM-dependent methyltransferase